MWHTGSFLVRQRNHENQKTISIFITRIAGGHKHKTSDKIPLDELWVNVPVGIYEGGLKCADKKEVGCDIMLA
jgi:hypothetical protein